MGEKQKSSAFKWNPIRTGGLFDNPFVWSIIGLWLLESRGPENIFFTSLKPVEDYKYFFNFPIRIIISIIVVAMLVVSFSVIRTLFLSDVSPKWDNTKSNMIARAFAANIAISFGYVFTYNTLGVGESARFIGELIGIRSYFFAGEAYSIARLILFALSCYYTIKFVFLWAASIGCAYSALMDSRQFGSNAITSEKPPLDERVRNIIDHQNSVLRSNNYKQALVIVLMSALTAVGIYYFHILFRQSYFSHINNVLSSITEQKIYKIIEAAPYDIRMGEINRELEVFLYNAKKKLSSTDGAGNLRKNDVDTIMVNMDILWRDVSQKTKNVSSGNAEFAGKFESEMRGFSRRMDDVHAKLRDIPQVDWESIVIRMAILTLVTVMLKLFFNIFMSLRDVSERIRIDILAIELAATSSNATDVADLLRALHGSAVNKRKEERAYEGDAVTELTKQLASVVVSSKK